MQQREFGKGGRKVGAIGFGAMSFSGSYGATTEQESVEALAACLEVGSTHWDTSDVYGFGVSENVIGRFFRENKGARSKVFLATKGGIKRRPGTVERVFDNSPEYLRSCLEGSLRRLGVDHVDLYYLHRRDPEARIEDIAGTMAKFVEEGKIGGYGLSEVAPFTLRQAHAVHPVRAVQSEYSIWSRMPELGMLQTCKELGVAFVAFSPLGRGVFAGGVTPHAEFGPLDFRRGSPRFVGDNLQRNLASIAPFLTFARERGMSGAQAALRWVLAQGEHIIPIPGTRYAPHVRDNAGAGSGPLSAAELAEIDRLLPMGFVHGARYTLYQQIGAELYG